VPAVRQQSVLSETVDSSSAAHTVKLFQGHTPRQPAETVGELAWLRVIERPLGAAGTVTAPRSLRDTAAVAVQRAQVEPVRADCRARRLSRNHDAATSSLRGTPRQAARGASQQCLPAPLLRRIRGANERHHAQAGFGWQRWSRRWLYARLGLSSHIRSSTRTRPSRGFRTLSQPCSLRAP